MRLRLLMLLCVAWLGGCASYSAMGPSPGEPVSANSAVLELVEQAKRNSEYGDYALAEASIERALRMEPRNPYLWFELAQVNKLQGNASKAKSFALRARSYASTDTMRKRIDGFVAELSV